MQAAWQKLKPKFAAVANFRGTSTGRPGFAGSEKLRRPQSLGEISLLAIHVMGLVSPLRLGLHAWDLATVRAKDCGRRNLWLHVHYCALRDWVGEIAAAATILRPNLASRAMGSL